MTASTSMPVLNGQVLAAPAQVYPVPQMVTAMSTPSGFSYVPAVPGMERAAVPLISSMPAEIQPPPPQPPQRLTEGIPDPNAIEQQKQAFSQGLDEQMRQGAAILNQQLKQQMDQLHALGDEQKKKYYVQVDHEIKSQESGPVRVWAHMGPYGPSWAHMGPILLKNLLILIKFIELKIKIQKT